MLPRPERTLCAAWQQVQGCWDLLCLKTGSHLRFTHLNQPCLHVQVKLLVEKTGCDAATLSAPFRAAWQRGRAAGRCYPAD